VLKQIGIGLALVALSGCAAMIGGKPPPAMAPQGDFRPSGPIALGNYEKESENAVRSAFAKTVVQRYAAGAPMALVNKDLAENRFPCGAAPQTKGDPPDQVCKRTIKAGGCTYTFQVHLYNDAGKTGIARVRGLYDKACGEDLLGG
jgi:hypothetical protein